LLVVGVLALALTLLGSVSACSDEVPAETELREALQASGLSAEVSECVASALSESLSDEELSELATRGSGAAPVDDPNRTDDSADQLRIAMDRCRLLQNESAPTTTTLSTTTPSTTIPSTTTAGG
jgi:hypothetical protein